MNARLCGLTAAALLAVSTAQSMDLPGMDSGGEESVSAFAARQCSARQAPPPRITRETSIGHQPAIQSAFGDVTKSLDTIDRHQIALEHALSSKTKDALRRIRRKTYEGVAGSGFVLGAAAKLIYDYLTPAASSPVINGAVTDPLSAITIGAYTLPTLFALGKILFIGASALFAIIKLNSWVHSSCKSDLHKLRDEYTGQLNKHKQTISQETAKIRHRMDGVLSRLETIDSNVGPMIDQRLGPFAKEVRKKFETFNSQLIKFDSSLQQNWAANQQISAETLERLEEMRKINGALQQGFTHMYPLVAGLRGDVQWLCTQKKKKMGLFSRGKSQQPPAKPAPVAAAFSALPQADNGQKRRHRSMSLTPAQAPSAPLDLSATFNPFSLAADPLPGTAGHRTTAEPPSESSE